MADAFQSLADALANLLGMSPVTCDYTTGCGPQGIILAFAVIVVSVIVLTWVLGEHAAGYGFLLSGSIGFLFAVMVKWIPYWVPLFMILVIVLVLVHPFGESQGAA